MESISKDTFNRVAIAYLNALNGGDSEKVLRLFSSNGKVLSPIYGACLAKDFYSSLFDDTLKSETSLIENVIDVEGMSMALVFNYKWTLRDGKEVVFDCVDIIHLDKKMQIDSLQILYDTHPIRPYLP